jgi:hypothetical protein
MRIPRRSLQFIAGLLVLLCLSYGTALASPVTVQLRVEGSAKTLFEGPVSVEAIPASPGLSTTSSAGPHPCDVKDNGGNEGFVAEGASPTAALYDAALASGLEFDAGWSGSFHDFFVTQVGSDAEGGAPNFEGWGYAVDYATANVGGCQFQLAPGNEVLWAFNYFNLTHLLSLSGPETANVGTPINLHVTDGRTGEAISGASIGEDVAGVTTPVPGSSTTDANGNATVTLANAGTVRLKAQSSGAVRSNGLVVCVHNGNDGTCETSLPAGGPAPPTSVLPDLAQIAGIVTGHVFARRSAPRLLRGLVKVPAGGTLREVRISLRRQAGKRCFSFSGTRGQFVRSRCATTSFFSVGDSLSFSYLLPARLPAGRYVYDIEAIDAGGHASALSSGTSHVVFRVR